MTSRIFDSIKLSKDKVCRIISDQLQNCCGGNRKLLWQFTVAIRCDPVAPQDASPLASPLLISYESPYSSSRTWHSIRTVYETSAEGNVADRSASRDCADRRRGD